MSEVWDEPTPDGKSTKGKTALRLMWRERPGDFAKLNAAVMPREFWVEVPALSAPKVIEHAH
jgi:hypothetical protein